MKTYDYAILGSTSIVSQTLIPYLIGHSLFKGKKILYLYRNSKKWDECKKKFSPEVQKQITFEAQCDGQNKDDLKKHFKDVSILLNMAGPYDPSALSVIRACLDSQTHYLDITGEVRLVHEVIQLYDQEAKEKGITIVPCAGFDSVPSDFLACLLAKYVHQQGEVLKSIDTTFDVMGGVSGGSFHSAIGIFEKTPPKDLENQGLYIGQHLPVPLFRIKQQGAEVQSTFFMEFINSKIVRRSLQQLQKSGALFLSPRFTYGEWNKAGVISLASFAGSKALEFFLSSPLGRKLGHDYGPKKGNGPSARSIASGHVRIVGRARSEGKNKSSHYEMIFESKGDPGNQVTSQCLAMCAHLVSIDPVAGGFKTASQLTIADHVAWATQFGITLRLA